MINLQAILTANGAAVLLLLIVIFNRKNTVHYGLFDQKLYTIMVIINIWVCFSETASFIVDGKTDEVCRVLAPFFNSASYFLNICFSFIWIVYVDYKNFEDKKRLHRIYSFLAIPALLIAAGAVVNLFTPVFFAMSADNVYSRMPLHTLPYTVTYFYLIYGAVLAYRAKNSSTATRKYLFMPVIIFLIPVFLSSILQYVFYGVSLIWLGTAIGLVSIYINLQNQTTYIDSLSGVFNRQYLDNYLTVWSDNRRPGETLAGYMLDIDGFKSINDRFGHLAGDKTIRDVGKALRGCAGERGFAARYGGDEFVIIKHLKTENDMKKQAKDLYNILDKLEIFSDSRYNVHLSIGYGLFDEDDTVDKFIKKIDTEMYRKKQLSYYAKKNVVN